MRPPPPLKTSLLNREVGAGGWGRNRVYPSHLTYLAGCFVLFRNKVTNYHRERHLLVLKPEDPCWFSNVPKLWCEHNTCLWAVLICSQGTST